MTDWLTEWMDGLVSEWISEWVIMYLRVTFKILVWSSPSLTLRRLILLVASTLVLSSTPAFCLGTRGRSILLQGQFSLVLRWACERLMEFWEAILKALSRSDLSDRCWELFLARLICAYWQDLFQFLAQEVVSWDYAREGTMERSDSVRLICTLIKCSCAWTIPGGNGWALG
jgi:hypothetical protein